MANIFRQLRLWRNSVFPLFCIDTFNTSILFVSQCFICLKIYFIYSKVYLFKLKDFAKLEIWYMNCIHPGWLWNIHNYTKILSYCKHNKKTNLTFILWKLSIKHLIAEIFVLKDFKTLFRPTSVARWFSKFLFKFSAGAIVTWRLAGWLWKVKGWRNTGAEYFHMGFTVITSISH